MRRGVCHGSSRKVIVIIVTDVVQRLGGYVLVMPLAHGEHSRVYLARAPGNEAVRGQVAIKRYDRPLAAAELSRARLLASFESAYFARILEASQDGSFAALYYLEGWSIAEIIAERGAIVFDNAARICGAMLRGLEESSSFPWFWAGVTMAVAIGAGVAIGLVASNAAADHCLCITSGAPCQPCEAP